MADKQAQKSQFSQIEEQILEMWGKENTFNQSLKLREGKPYYSFYDGPPFANGLPHFGHSLVQSIKDSIGRYKTMRGYYVERRNGWDCHGLPVEFAIEKQLGVSGKKQILELGLEKFNAACRDSVFTYKHEWEDFFHRIGRWTDVENAYATIDREFTESVWWTLGEIHKKGLLYKGFKSMPYCPRCETPLSNFELNEGYKDNVSDPSLFVKFKVAGEDRSFLAWTTTPWSLPGNAALAVDPKETYVTVEISNDDGQTEQLILAKKRLEVLDQEYKVLQTEKGKALVGKKYEPLFAVKGFDDPKLYHVLEAEEVSVEEGSGVLHVAPTFGEDDLNLGQAHGLPIVHTVDPNGHLKSGLGIGEAEGKFFKSADRLIIEQLTEEGKVYAAETFEHTYPFCYRCETPLLYYAVSTWFIKVSAIREDLLKSAQSIEWTPGHIKDGRFGKWLEGARDWAVSRNRYWGAPMPVWVNEEDENDYTVISSIAELQELAGQGAKLDDLHRPFIDEVTFQKDGKTYRRIEEVLDCWFESGSMPVAQQHFPFDNKDKFEQTFPADYVGEGLDQTRLWFYVLHVISTILFDKPAYKHVLVNGMIMAADGQKLSKRLKNYPPIEDVFENEGADSLRLYLLSSYQAVNGDYMRFNRDAMKDLNRNVLMTLLNSFRFFKMYADIDKWEPQEFAEPKSTNVLDQWILARLNQTVQETTKQADNYQLAHAINPIFDLVDDLSNWYVRRSRRRFWKSEDDADKQQAYATLHYVLVRTSQLLAPWAPFMSDYLYRELTKGMKDMPSSVHLTDWPEAGALNDTLVEQMQLARDFITEGLNQRAAAGIKVRQPLAKAEVPELANDSLLDIIADELNVKTVAWVKWGNNPVEARGLVEIETIVTPELKREGLMRDVVRQVQQYRKEQGLEVDDRINLQLGTSDKELEKAITEHAETIKSETLALDLTSKAKEGKTVKIEDAELIIGIKKAA